MEAENRPASPHRQDRALVGFQVLEGYAGAFGDAELGFVGDVGRDAPTSMSDVSVRRQCPTSVSEVALAGEIHGHSGCLGRRNYLGIALRTARLNHCLHAAIDKHLKSIGKRKECV
mgnify:CR=1 FL=1